MAVRREPRFTRRMGHLGCGRITSTLRDAKDGALGHLWRDSQVSRARPGAPGLGSRDGWGTRLCERITSHPSRCEGWGTRAFVARFPGLKSETWGTRFGHGVMRVVRVILSRLRA